LWSLPLLRYSRAAWTRSYAACSGWPCFGRRVGLEDPQMSLPTPNILWFWEIILRNPDHFILTQNLSRLKRAFLDHYTLRKLSCTVTFNQYFQEKKRKREGGNHLHWQGHLQSWAGRIYQHKILAVMRNSKGNSAILQGELLDYGKKDELQSLIYLSCSCTLCPQFKDFT